MRRLGTLMLSLLMLTLAGCGLAEKAADKVAEKAAEKAIEAATGVKVDSDNNSITIKDKEGKELTIAGGEEGKLPEGFPLPVYQGAKIAAATTMTTDNKKSFAVELELTAEPKAVADYYEAQLKDRGMEVTRMDNSSKDGDNFFLMAENTTDSAMVTISKIPDSPTQVNILVGPKS